MGFLACFIAAAHPVHQRHRSQGGGPDTDTDSGFGAVFRDSGLGYHEDCSEAISQTRVGRRNRLHETIDVRALR